MVTWRHQWTVSSPACKPLNFSYSACALWMLNFSRLQCIRKYRLSLPIRLRWSLSNESPRKELNLPGLFLTHRLFDGHTGTCKRSTAGAGKCVIVSIMVLCWELGWDGGRVAQAIRRRVRYEHWVATSLMFERSLQFVTILIITLCRLHAVWRLTELVLCKMWVWHVYVYHRYTFNIPY